MDAAEINATIDGNPGSNFDLVRIKGDVDENTARLIAEAGFELPGVQVAVEARRDYTYGSLFSQILGYTGPVSADELAQLKAQGYLPDDLARQDRARGRIRERAARDLRQPERRAGRRGTPHAGPPDGQRAGRRATRLNLTIDTKEQKYAQTALEWAMKEIGLKRGVVIVDESADRRDPGHGQPADLRRQPLRARHQQRRLPGAGQQSGPAAAQPRDAGALPAGLDLQARDRDRRAGRQEDHVDDPARRPRRS